jgi:hypothetical protein
MLSRRPTLSPRTIDAQRQLRLTEGGNVGQELAKPMVAAEPVDQSTGRS